MKYISVVLVLLRKARSLRVYKEILALRNTVAPIPLAIVERRLRFGHRIHQQQVEKWSKVGNYDWKHYVEMDDYSKALTESVAGRADANESILDICCNVGRNLNQLANLGFSHLQGVDIMGEAIERAPEIFPALRSASLTVGNLTDYLPSLPPKSVDWAITQSATVELIHPSFRIHRELERVVRRGLVFVISERGHAYPRYWRFLLQRSGFVELERRVLPGGLTLLVYLIEAK